MVSGTVVVIKSNNKIPSAKKGKTCMACHQLLYPSYDPVEKSTNVCLVELDVQGWIEQKQCEARFRFAQGQLLETNLSKDTN